MVWDGDTCVGYTLLAIPRQFGEYSYVARRTSLRQLISKLVKVHHSLLASLVLTAPNLHRGCLRNFLGKAYVPRTALER